MKIALDGQEGASLGLQTFHDSKHTDNKYFTQETQYNARIMHAVCSWPLSAIQTI